MHFTRNSTWNHLTDYPFVPGTINLNRKDAFSKVRVLVCPLCVCVLIVILYNASSSVRVICVEREDDCERWMWREVSASCFKEPI